MKINYSIKVGLTLLIVFSCTSDKTPINNKYKKRNPMADYFLMEGNKYLKKHDFKIVKSLLKAPIVFDGKNLKKDDFFSTINDKIYETHTSPEKALVSVSRDLLKRNEILTIFVGHESILDNYDKLENQILDNFTDKEVVIVDGNQSYYNYLLLAE